MPLQAYNGAEPHALTTYRHRHWQQASEPICQIHRSSQCIGQLCNANESIPYVNVRVHSCFYIDRASCSGIACILEMRYFVNWPWARQRWATIVQYLPMAHAAFVLLLLSAVVVVSAGVNPELAHKFHWPNCVLLCWILYGCGRHRCDGCFNLMPQALHTQNRIETFFNSDVTTIG